MKLILLQVLLILVKNRLIFNSRSKRRARRGPHTEIQVVKGNTDVWTYGQQSLINDDGFMVCGMQVSYKQFDDKLNGIDQMMVNYCKVEKWEEQQQQYVLQTTGITDPHLNCPKDSFILALMARQNENKAIEGIKFKCKNILTGLQQDIEVLIGFNGAWTDWIYTGKYLSGLKISVEEQHITGLEAVTKDLVCADQLEFNPQSQTCFQRLPNCETQYFSNKCIKCKENYILNQMKMCSLLIENCLEYGADDKCTKCEENFFIENGLCLKTMPKSLKNCKTSEEGVCQMCEENFVLSLKNECFEKIQNCLQQNEENCHQCDDGYQILLVIDYQKNEKQQNLIQKFKSICYKNLEHCQKLAAEDSCGECDEGFILNDGKCFLKIQNCVQQVNDKCLTCDENFILQDGKCGGKIENCEKQENDKCLQCSIDYKISATFDCEKKDEQDKLINCQIADIIKKECLTCDTDYILGYCFKKIDNCGKTEQGLCTECIEGYDLMDGGNQCVPTSQRRLRTSQRRLRIKKRQKKIQAMKITKFQNILKN